MPAPNTRITTLQHTTTKQRARQDGMYKGMERVFAYFSTSQPLRKETRRAGGKALLDMWVVRVAGCDGELR